MSRQEMYMGQWQEDTRGLALTEVEASIVDLELADWYDDLYDVNDHTREVWERVENTTPLGHHTSFRTIEEMEAQDAKMDYLDDEDLKRFIEVHQQLQRQIKEQIQEYLVQ